MVEDDKVIQVMERRDLDAKEKLILIDVLMREPKPEKRVDENTGNTEYYFGHAVAPSEAVAERTGLSEKTTRERMKRLHSRGFLKKKPSKGRLGNRYIVTFPKRATQNKA